jgi:hypothetical protein
MKEQVCNFAAYRGGAPIKHISGGSEGLNPEGWQHGSMKEEGADGVIDGVKHMLSFAILLRRVCARKMK